jgi:hypothetical protein
MKARGLQQTLHPPRGIHRHVLLINITHARAAVMAAVAGIKDHRIKRMGLGLRRKETQHSEEEA